MSDIQQYTRVAQTLDATAILGYVCLSTVYDGVYSPAEVTELFEALNLDTTMIPQPATASDAFRRAVSEHRETKYELANGDTVTLMLREVTSNNPREVITRAMTREVSAGDRPLLGYESLGEFRFYPGVRRGNLRLIDHSAARLRFLGVNRQTMPHIDDAEWAHIRQICAAVDHDFNRFRSTLDGRKVRQAVLNYLRALDAVQLKRSVYFVPVKHADEVLRLQEAVNSLGECRLNLIPLPDLADQREMIIRSFQEQEVSEMSALAREIADLKSKTPSLTTFGRLRARYDELTARTQVYVEALNVSIDATTGAHDFVRASLNSYTQALLK